MTLHQYDYLFAIGIIFASLDAWNIGSSLRHRDILLGRPLLTIY